MRHSIARLYRKTISAACMLVFATTAWTAQALAEDVTIGPKWRAGDTFRVEVTRIREDSARPQQNGRSRTMVDVRVLSVTPKGASVVEWAPGESTIDNPQVAQDPLLTAASQAVRGIVFRLNLDEDGAIAGIANQEEVAPKLQAMMNTIVQPLSASLPAEQRKGFQDMMAQLLSPQALIASAIRDAEIYFGLNGAVLAPGESAEVDLELPSPFGGGVIPAKLRVEMLSATAESASLKSATTYDAAALLRMTQALTQQAGKPIPPEELKSLSLKMDDDGKYAFDRTAGLMREVVINRRVTSGNSRRLDGWQIRLITGPNRNPLQ